MIKFDIEFYKNFYPDVKKLKTNKQIYQHYSLCGYKENRIICEEEFNKLYPDFNLEHYNQQFIQLKWTKYQLMKYYSLNNKLINYENMELKHFYIQFPIFDIEYYKKNSIYVQQYH